MRPFTHLSLIVLASLALLTIGGCLESEVVISSEQPMAVDRRYVGDWKDAEKELTLIIRNWDDREYYIESTPADEGATTRLRGFTVDVNGVSFAHLRELTDDGSIPNKFLIMRVHLADGTLTLRNLDPGFFRDKDISTGKGLREALAENLEDEAMYAKGPAVSLTRNPARQTAEPTKREQD